MVVGDCTVRFIHTADWQLGMTRAFLNEDAQIRYAQDQLEVIASIGVLAKAQHADFVVVCGDVFESNFVERRTILRALEAIGLISIPVYILPGNHDPLDQSSIYASKDFVENKPKNAIVLDKETPLEIGPGLQLLPAPWTSKRPQCDLLKRACAHLSSQDGVLRIAVAHGAVDNLSRNKEDPNLIQLEALQAKIKEGAVHYIALGDRHSSTRIADRIWYSGSPLATSFDEVDSGKVLVVDLDSDKCRVDEHKVSAWSFIQQSLTIVGDAGIDDISEILKGIPAKDRSVFRIGVKGVLSLEGKARFEDLLDKNRQLFASLEIWNEETDLLIQPSADDLANLNLGGFAKVALDRLLEMSTTDGPDSESARDALGLFYRLAKGVGR
jgi:DNA repair exonuclease SbcCD nuclease subunit